METKKNKKKKNIRNLLLKIVLCIFYFIVICVLVYSAYSIFKEEDKIVSWNEVKKTDQYSKLKISQMSEAFAKIGNKQIHFVMEKETTGAWHTYLIAIKKENYKKYKDIIDFTYERTKNRPNSMEIYGYPRKIPDDVKKLAIKNITKFVPIENQTVITETNFDKYLTNTYLDTTIKQTHSFNYYVLVLLIMSFILFIVIIYTIFEKDKKVKSKKKNNKNNKNLRNRNDNKIENKNSNNKISQSKSNKSNKLNKTKVLERANKESNSNISSKSKKEKTEDDDIEII